MAYAPMLTTAETAITGLVSGRRPRRRSRRREALSRAVGARGQMAMQQMLVTRGADLPEPQLRSAMVTLAGTEPSTLFGDGRGSSAAASTGRPALRSRVWSSGRRCIAEPTVPLVGNPDLLASQQITRDIADRSDRRDGTRSIPATVAKQAAAARTAAIRDAALVIAAIVIALLLVTLVARTLVRPLRTLRDSALRVAHDDLAREVEQVRRDGKEPGPVAAHPGAHLRGDRSGRARRRRTARAGRATRRRAGPTAAPGRPTCSKRCRGATDPWWISSSPSSTDSNATKRTPSDSRACSGSITSQPGCAATVPT